MRQVTKGSINISVDVYIIDSTTGVPELGVLFNTAGIDLEYRRDLAAAVNITEVTLAALTTAHTDGGFLEIGHGYYRLDVPDAAFASGVKTVSVQGTVTGMIVLPQTIQLVAFDTEDAVRMGLTALPNAVVDAAGGLATSAGGATGIDDLATPTNITAGTISTVTTLTGHTAQTGDNFARIGATGSGLTSLAQASEVTSARMATLTDWINGGRLDLLLDAIPTTAMRGTDNAATATALATVDGIVDAILVDTADMQPRVVAIETDTGTTLETHLTDMQGATFSGATDSLEAIRNRGDAAWTSGAGSSGVVDTGTAQSATSTTLVLRSAAAFDDDELIGAVVLITGGTTGVGQSRTITDSVGSTDTVTVDTWTTTPTGTITYDIFAAPPAPTTLPIVNATQINGTVQTAGDLAALITTVDTVVDGIQTDLSNGTDGLGAIKAETALIVADTNELQTDDVPGLIATVDGIVDSILLDTAEIGTAGAGLTNITINAASVDAVWDEDIVAAHTTADTAGAKLAAAGGAADPWATGLPGAYGAGTAGEILGDWKNGGRLDLLIDAIPTTAMRGTDNAATAASLATAQTDLDTLTGTDGVTLATTQALYAPAKAGDNMGTVSSVTGAVGSVTGSVGSVTGAVGSVTGAVGSVTGNVGGNVTGSVGSNLELGPSEVNAEVVDALNTDTYAEPVQGAPGATISLAAKIGFLYKAWRNRSTQTATVYSLYNDDAVTVDHKATVSDDATTADKTEVITGP